MNLIGRMAVVIVASGGISVAQADLINVGFYQGGFDEGAFLIGAFSGIDKNGDGELKGAASRAWPNSGSDDEILSFHLYFSGNSIVPTFTQTGIEALQPVPCCLEDEAFDRLYLSFNLVTMSIDWLTSSLWEVFEPLPNSACAEDSGWDPENPTYCVDNWRATTPRVYYENRELQGSDTSRTYIYSLNPDTSGRLAFGPATVSEASLRVYLIPEPSTLALLGIGLFGMGSVKRRKLA